MGLIDERYKNKTHPLKQDALRVKFVIKPEKHSPFQKAGDKYFRIKFLYKILRNLFFFLS